MPYPRPFSPAFQSQQPFEFERSTFDQKRSFNMARIYTIRAVSVDGDLRISKPKAPSPPDPVATAQAQAQYNSQAARDSARLNRVDQVTPYGSTTFSEGPNDRWQQTVTESDSQRQLREAQEKSGIALGNLGAQQAEKVGSILGQNYTSRRFNSADVTGGRFDPNAFGGQEASLDLGKFDPQSLDVDLSSFDPRQVSMDLGQYDPTQRADLQARLGRYDPTRALGNFGGDVAARQFALGTMGLDRKFGRAEEGLRSRLANQGITQDSDAFRSEMAGFQEGVGNAYSSALLNAAGEARAQRGQAAGELAQGSSNRLAELDFNRGNLDRGATLTQSQAAFDRQGLQMAADNQMRQQGFNRENMGMAADLAQSQAGFDDQQRQQRIANALLGRQTNLAEAEAQYGRDSAADLADRQIPLQEISAILNGTPIQRTDPGQIYTQGIDAPDYQGAVALQQQALQNQYNQRMGGRNAIIGGLAGLGGAAIGGGGIFGKVG
jgi:hypothetical protein